MENDQKEFFAEWELDLLTEGTPIFRELVVKNGYPLHGESWK